MEGQIWAMLGCHPHSASSYTDQHHSLLSEFMSRRYVVALGEIGLDYSKGNGCPKEVQQDVLRRQISLALFHKKPICLHVREADEDCFAIAKDMIPSDWPIHLHCFNQTWRVAQRWMNNFEGLFLGFTNLITYPGVTHLHEVVRKIPLSRTLLETDAPYFVPRVYKLGTPSC